MKKRIRTVGITVFVILAAINVFSFPWSSDDELSSKDTEAQRAFYGKAYQTAAAPTDSDTTDYTKGAVGLHEVQQTKPRLAKFIEEKGLTKGRSLEVGSGVGFFQDVMEHYTGLDISPSVARFYRKPFVLGSATAMPFQDSEFDLAFTFYVLEHIPNPEQALREMRRVTKSGGYLYLEPSWKCSRFLSQGYAVRPYSDFGWAGKLIKFIQPLVESSSFRATHVVPARLLRTAAAQLGPTKFHYTRLTPNYDHYWEADSDAVNSLDRAEMTLWFTSRGDECLNCSSPISAAFTRSPERWLIIKVNK